MRETVTEKQWRGSITAFKTGARVEFKLDDDWVAHVRLAPQNGRPIVTGIAVWPVGGQPSTVPLGGMQSRTIRKLRLGDAFSIFREVADAWDPEVFGPTGPLGQFGFVSAEPPPRRSPGRSGYDDLFYARIAARYVRKVRTGTRSPVVELARELSWTPEYLREVLGRARQRKLLTPSPPGRPGGALTKRTRHLLRKDTEESG
jgi:hypothetical protein